MKEKEKTSILKNWKLYGIIFIIILSIIGITIVALRNKLTPEEIEVSTNISYGKEIKLTNSIKKSIYEKVKNNILDGLKTPSTAVFQEMKDWNIDVNLDNVIEVKSYVDSQNSYGAMLRTNFEQKYIYNKGEYICIYKEFNNETKFGITEETEYKRFINKKIHDFQIEDFISKSKNATVYGNLIDYNFNEESQNLEINILVKKIDSSYYDYRQYIDGVIAAYIDQCICIPTVVTKLNIKNEKDETLVTVNDINIEFLLNDWYTLWDLSIMDNTDGTNLEEKLKEKLVINDKSLGRNLDQEKLEKIKEEYNNRKYSTSGKIKNVIFNEDCSKIDIEITSKNMEKKEDKQYWIYFNIIDVIDYIKKFNNIGEIELKLYQGETELAYAKLNESFLKNVWKDNQITTKVPELFGNNYKEML